MFILVDFEEILLSGLAGIMSLMSVPSTTLCVDALTILMLIIVKTI